MDSPDATQGRLGDGSRALGVPCGRGERAGPFPRCSLSMPQSGLDDIGSAGSISTAAILPEPLHTYMPLDRLLRPAKSGVVLLCGHRQFPSFQPVARRHAAMCSRFVCLHRPTLRRSAKWRRASWLSMNRRRPHVILALLSLCVSTWMQVECSCCSCSHLPNQCMIPAYLLPAVRAVGCWGVGQHAGES